MRDGQIELLRQPEGRDYAARQGLTAERLANSTHIAWATGGALVPEDIRKAYQTMYL